MMFQDWMSKMRAASAVPFGTAYELFAQKAWDASATAERDKWREIVGQLIACHDEPSCPAVTVAKEWLDAGAEQVGPPSSEVRVLEAIIKVLSRELDGFVGACLDGDEQPRTPDRGAMMRARSMLPPHCKHALKKAQQ